MNFEIDLFETSAGVLQVVLMNSKYVGLPRGVGVIEFPYQAGQPISGVRVLLLRWNVIIAWRKRRDG